MNMKKLPDNSEMETVMEPYEEFIVEDDGIYKRVHNLYGRNISKSEMVMKKETFVEAMKKYSDCEERTDKKENPQFVYNFNVSVDVQGNLYINNEFVSQLCFNEDAIGSEITNWLKNNEPDFSSDKEQESLSNDAKLDLIISIGNNIEKSINELFDSKVLTVENCGYMKQDIIDIIKRNNLFIGYRINDTRIAVKHYTKKKIETSQISILLNVLKSRGIEVKKLYVFDADNLKYNMNSSMDVSSRFYDNIKKFVSLNEISKEFDIDIYMRSKVMDENGRYVKKVFKF